MAGYNRPMSQRSRALIACLYCRKKRKRCDADHHVPCTNCLLDEINCDVPKANRILRKPPSAKESIKKQQLQDIIQHDDVSKSSLPEIEVEVANGFLTVSSTLANDTPTCSMPPQHEDNRATVNYLKGLPPELDKSDVDYLAAKGALWIPSRDLLCALFCSYIDFVHPFLPILELSKLVLILQEGAREQDEKISMLLLQAIMFAASAFVDEQLLVEGGFSCRRTARKELYQRVKLLAEFDIDPDGISYIQSLLLMTYWYETPDDMKSMRHWVGIVLSVANGIDLNQDPERLGYDAHTCKLRKRLWWSCVLRDTAIALGMRHCPLTISDTNCVPMLTLDDFDIEPLSISDRDHQILSRVVHDTHLRCLLARMCIEKAKLCLILGEVLSVQYTTHKTGQSYNEDGIVTSLTMSLLPQLGNDKTRIEACEQNLRNWAEKLPEDMRYRSFALSALDEENRILQLHTSLFHMLYYTTVMTFYRPWTICGRISLEISKQNIARHSIRSAATAISKISRDLYHTDLTRFLPLTGIIALMTATIYHLKDSCCGKQIDRMNGMWHFNNCYRSIQILRLSYPLADHASYIVEVAAGNSSFLDAAGGANLAHKENAAIISPVSKKNFVGSLSKHTGEGESENRDSTVGNVTASNITTPSVSNIFDNFHLGMKTDDARYTLPGSDNENYWEGVADYEREFTSYVDWTSD